MKKLFSMIMAVLMIFLAIAAYGEETVCSTPEEFLAYLREVSLSTAPYTNVRFEVPCTRELTRELMNNLDYLTQLERQAGMGEAHFDVPRSDKITYINSRFVERIYEIKSLDDFDAMLQSMAGTLEETVYFYIDPSVRDTINEFDMRERVHYGSMQVTLNAWYTLLPYVTHSDVSYSDGVQILHAYRNNTRSQLKDEELKQTYDIAVNIVNGLKGKTDYERAVELHDYLCQTIHYGNGPSVEHAGAVSALKYGQCVCYGYSDAYYLLCGIAGIPCCYQAGWIGEKPPRVFTWDSSAGSGHAWNLIKVNGKWSMVDVTWDDSDNGYHYKYFLVGRREARNSREWIENGITRQWAD